MVVQGAVINAHLMDPSILMNSTGEIQGEALGLRQLLETHLRTHSPLALLSGSSHQDW